MTTQAASREREFLLALCGTGILPVHPTGWKPVPQIGRTAVVVAHPDDEVIGLGAHMPRLKLASFIYITDGAPRDGRDASRNGFADCRDYAVARRRETHAALSLAGICPSRMQQFEYPDQGASLHMADIARKLVEVFRAQQVEAVLTHAYEGGHPDHDATAFTAHAAHALLQREGADPPALVEMTSYHNSPHGLEPCTFLADRAEEDVSVVLSPALRAFKYRLLACYATQWDALQYFPVEVERFRPAPAYDFTQPPHLGRLFYELHPWGMTGERFCKLARSALYQLGLSGRI
jgi:N-acetylglucosamine malate deacetylase 2